LTKTRTLISGVGGFTGHYVASRLAEAGHEIHGIVHSTDGEIDGVDHIYEADLADLSSVASIVQEVRPDHVVHLAGIAFVAHEDVEQIYRSNVVGTRQLLEALARLEHPIRSIILASSANVYGNAREGVLDEELSFAPANDYGVSKVALEYVATLYKARLPLIVVRPFNYTGRGQSAQFIVPKIVNHARDRAPEIELGNLDVARDFSDVRTVAEAYAKLLEEPKAIGGTFNVCSGRAVSLRELLELVWQLSNHRFDVRVNPAFVRENDVRVLLGSKEKIERVVGPLPAIPLEETLRWMLDA
jgi:GDP-6-deoxy-D-talose 4-dehydrogenase